MSFLHKVRAATNEKPQLISMDEIYNNDEEFAEFLNLSVSIVENLAYKFNMTKLKFIEFYTKQLKKEFM